MTEKTLDDLKDALYKAFEVAARRSLVDSLEKSADRVAVGTIAQAIVAIEKEQREAAEAKETKAGLTLDK